MPSRSSISPTWQSSQERPPIASASATAAAQTDVAAPCAIDFCSNGASPEALAAAVICLNRAAICSGGTSRPRSVSSEEHTSELQSLMRISYAVFCLKKKNKQLHTTNSENLINIRH